MGGWTDHTAAFADEYLRFLLDCNNETALLHLLRLMKEAAFIEYIEAGVLEKKESSRIQIGADFYGTTGTATDGVSIQSALTASAYAGSVACTIAESRNDMSSSLAKAIIEEIEILGYLAGGFETVRWADHISGYFEDAGGFLRDELDKVLEPVAAQAWPIPISEEVQTLLRDSESRIKEPEFRLNESGTRRVWGQIISPSFDGKPPDERQSMVWDYLGLHPEVAQRVNYLETLTPQEASSN